MTRAGAALVSIALIGATLSPVVRDPDDDGFPLSTFPMFALPRPSTVTVAYALGVTATGTRGLTPQLAGASQVLQAQAIFDRAMAAGPDVMAPLCAAIANRVVLDRGYADVLAIELVLGTHDAVGYFARGEPGQVTVRMRCEVPR